MCNVGSAAWWMDVELHHATIVASIKLSTVTDAVCTNKDISSKHTHEMRRKIHSHSSSRQWKTKDNCVWAHERTQSKARVSARLYLDSQLPLKSKYIATLYTSLGTSTTGSIKALCCVTRFVLITVTKCVMQVQSKSFYFVLVRRENFVYLSAWESTSRRN